jgi:hypothetical protein
MKQNGNAKDGPFYEANFVFLFCFGWLDPCRQKSVPGSRTPKNDKLTATGLRAARPMWKMYLVPDRCVPKASDV